MKYSAKRIREIKRNIKDCHELGIKFIAIPYK